MNQNEQTKKITWVDIATEMKKRISRIEQWIKGEMNQRREDEKEKLNQRLLKGECVICGNARAFPLHNETCGRFEVAAWVCSHECQNKFFGVKEDD